MVFTKKSKLSPLHKGMLIGAGTVAVFAGVVSAVGKSAVTPIGINEVREAGTVEKTLTGTVTREKVEPSGKERYVITAEGGVKYALIGLKQSYERPTDSKDNNENKPEEKRDQGKNTPKTAKTPTPTPKADPAKVDREDINSFESYVGKKVTITGFVVPVDNGMANYDGGQGNRPSFESKEKDNNGKKPSTAPNAKPSVKPSSSPKDNGWDLDRFVVKSVKLVK